MSGDNGKLELTPEELKKQTFESNPDQFINIDDLIIAVKKVDKGIETLVAPTSREQLEISLSRVTHHCFGIFNAMSNADQQANKPKIQTNGIMNFARRIKK